MERCSNKISLLRPEHLSSDPFFDFPVACACQRCSSQEQLLDFTDGVCAPCVPMALRAAQVQLNITEAALACGRPQPRARPCSSGEVVESQLLIVRRRPRLRRLARRERGPSSMTAKQTSKISRWPIGLRLQRTVQHLCCIVQSRPPADPRIAQHLEGARRSRIGHRRRVRRLIHRFLPIFQLQCSHGTQMACSEYRGTASEKPQSRS